MSYRQWGPFHIFTLICPFILFGILFFTLRKQKMIVRQIVCSCVALVGIVFLILDMTHDTEWLSAHLPFHLCAMNGFMLPFVIMFRNKKLGNMLVLWSVGAIMAMIFNLTEVNYTTDNLNLWIYFISHLVQATLPLTIVLLKIIDYDYRTIPSTLIITFCAYSVCHLINMELNDYYFLIDDNRVINYMFSYTHENNPVLMFFYSFLPYPYLYMLPCIPVLFIFECIRYSPQIIKALKNKNLFKKQIK